MEAHKASMEKTLKKSWANITANELAEQPMPQGGLRMHGVYYRAIAEKRKQEAEKAKVAAFEARYAAWVSAGKPAEGLVNEWSFDFIEDAE